MIHIYDCNEIFLYEIIEDYKTAKTQNEKDEIFKSFCDSIWISNNKRRTYFKSIRFNVRKDLLYTEVGQVFYMWSEVDYKSYKSMTKDENWCSIIRQKINNIYTRYFDKEVILDKIYMDLIKIPKQLYYKWISGVDMSADKVTEIIDDAIYESIQIKKVLQLEKMDLSWNDYKIVIEGYLRRCFNNCRQIDEYEDKTKVVTQLDFLTEDNFYVKYFCKSLNGYIKDYQKQYYGLKYSSRNGYIRCKQCRKMIERTGNKKLYCDECAKIRKKISNKKADKKYKNKKRENRKV